MKTIVQRNTFPPTPSRGEPRPRGITKVVADQRETNRQTDELSTMSMTLINYATSNFILIWWSIKRNPSTASCAVPVAAKAAVTTVSIRSAQPITVCPIHDPATSEKHTTCFQEHLRNPICSRNLKSPAD